MEKFEMITDKCNYFNLEVLTQLSVFCNFSILECQEHGRGKLRYELFNLHTLASFLLRASS